MRVFEVIDHADVIEFDVEILVDALERTADLDIVLELDGNLMVDQCLEKAERYTGQFPAGRSEQWCFGRM